MKKTAILATAIGLGACSSAAKSDAPSGDTSSTGSVETGESSGEASGSESGDSEGERATITHNFGSVTLEPSAEVVPCVQWTLGNEEPIYVQSVKLSNLGFFHHSNWFVVPEDVYPGEDGYFDCEDREFSEVIAAVEGTVLFAQSTQSYEEEQRTRDGAVIKIPPHSKVVGGTHMLNVTPGEVETDLWMTFELVHPRLVDVLLTAFRLSYLDLEIPAESLSSFKGRCTDMAEAYESRARVPFDVKLHYALPHFHYLGNRFHAEVTGGPDDGKEILSTVGFNGEANGKMFDPPLDLSGADGITFECGYDNWTDAEVGWGIGDQEMCVMLGLAEAEVMMDVTVGSGNQAVGMTDEGVIEFEGPCRTFVLPKNASQSMPTQAEIEGEFYLPPTDPGDADMPPLPECLDVQPDGSAALEPTLTNVASIFIQSCAFNSCHGSAAKAGNLDLENRSTLHAQLVGRGSMLLPDVPLVEPGDPQGSFLYQKMAQCSPAAGASMPLNAPILLADETVAVVREWIAAGAPDD